MTQRMISHLHDGLSEGWGGSRETLRLITSLTCGAAVRISASEKESQTSKNRNRENEPQEIIIKYRHVLTRDSRSWTDSRQTKTLHADFYWFLPQQEERSTIMKDHRNIRHSYTAGHKAVIKRCFRRDLKDTDDVLCLWMKARSHLFTGWDIRAPVTATMLKTNTRPHGATHAFKKHDFLNARVRLSRSCDYQDQENSHKISLSVNAADQTSEENQRTCHSTQNIKILRALFTAICRLHTHTHTYTDSSSFYEEDKSINSAC